MIPAPPSIPCESLGGVGFIVSLNLAHTLIYSTSDFPNREGLDPLNLPA